MNRLRQWAAQASRDTWNNWPLRAYARSGYRHRLSAVEDHLRDGLDHVPRGNVRIVSLCAGDGRDVLAAVESHSRRPDVTAWLVEADYSSVESGVAQVRKAGLQQTVQFLHADATVYATYLGIAPADVLLLCGVWGHVPPQDRSSVVDACRTLCREGGLVIWTRGVRRGRWRFDEICDYFDASQWKLTRSTVTPDSKWAVASHRLLSRSGEVPATGRIFDFKIAVG